MYLEKEIEMRRFNSALWLCLAIWFAVTPAMAEETENKPGVETFTLAVVELVATPSRFQGKIEALGDIGPAGFPLAFTWFAQGGGAVPFNLADENLSTWAMFEGGLAIKMPQHQHFFMVHRVRAGAIGLMNVDMNDDGTPEQSWSPQFAYCNAGHLFGKRLTWLTINEWAVSPEDGSVFYYYEGYVDGAPFGSAKQIGLGMFWENRGGPQVGPRFRAHGLYFHVGLLREPMFFLGIEHVW